MKEKSINFIITNKNRTMSTVLWNWNCCHLAQWHNVWAFRTSGWTLWHTGTLLVIWQAGTITDPWHRHTNDETQLSQSDRLCWHSHRMMWLVYRMVEDVDGWWFNVDLFSESEQAINQSTLRKLAQPHNQKDYTQNLRFLKGLEQS